jgi:cell wall-associated NlpC family hydrolase
LLYLAHRHVGASLPKDADDQADASGELGSDEAQSGDLYFFAGRGDLADTLVGTHRMVR